MGCSNGEHDATFHFLVYPGPDANFTGWTEITLGVDINSVGTAVLYGVTLTVKPPSTLPDLSFLSTLTGQADNNGTLTKIVSCDSFPAGQPSVDLDIDYYGDLHPLFMNSNTIRIDWSGSTNPSFTAWPSGGIWMQGDVVINVP